MFEKKIGFFTNCTEKMSGNLKQISMRKIFRSPSSFSLIWLRTQFSLRVCDILYIAGSFSKQTSYTRDLRRTFIAPFSANISLVLAFILVSY